MPTLFKENKYYCQYDNQVTVYDVEQYFTNNYQITNNQIILIRNLKVKQIF